MPGITMVGDYVATMLKSGFGDAHLPPYPDDWELALDQYNPESGSPGELSTFGYARLSVPNDDVTWGLSPDNLTIKNIVPLTFSAASGGDWLPVSYWELWDPDNVVSVFSGRFNGTGGYVVEDGGEFICAPGAIAINMRRSVL